MKNDKAFGIDLSRFVDVDTAAQLMNISSGHLRRQCSGLWKRGLAVKATPPGGGKERWFVSRDYDARLRDGSEGRRHQVPDLCHYSEHQRQEMWKRVEAVKCFREIRSQAKSKEADWLPALIETLKADPACPDKISRGTLHRWSKDYNCPADCIKLIDQSATHIDGWR